MAERITKVHQMGSFSHESATDWNIMFSNNDIQNVFKALIDDRSCAEIESIQFNLYTNVTCDKGYATVYTTVAFVNSASDGNNSSKRKYVGEIPSYRTDKNPTQSGSFDLTDYFNTSYPFSANGNTGGYNNLCIYFDTTSIWEKSWKITSMDLTVKYKDEHTIKVEVSPSNTGTVTGAGTYTHTHSAQLGVTPNNGYHTNYWNKNSSKITDSDGKNSISVKIEGNDTYTAVLQGNQYTVKYNGNGATGGSTTSSTHIYGTASNLRANGFSRSYTVTYDANGGSCNTNSNVATYSFANWNTSADGKGTTYGKQASISTLVTSGSKTLYAQWNSASVTLPTPTRTGYTFTGWYTSDNKPIGMGGVSYTPTANITLYAHWKINSYTLQIDPNGGYRVSDNSTAIISVTKDYNTTETISERRRTGYTLTGYTVKRTSDNSTSNIGGATFSFNSSTKEGIFKQGTTDITLTAQWTANSYTIIFDANTGTGLMDNLSMIYDQSKNLPQCTFEKTGYTFQGWSRDKNATSATYSDKQLVPNLATEDGASVTLFAVWKANEYTVVYHGNGETGGSTTTSDHIYDREKELTENGFERIYYVIYNPNKGQCSINTNSAAYEFLGWKDSNENEYSNKEIVLNLTTKKEPFHLYAQWGQKSVTLPIATRIGYTFDGWYTSDNKPIGMGGDEFIPNSNTELIAHWEEHTYTIIFNGNSGNGFMQSIVVDYSQEIALPEIGFTKLGYHFTGWITADNRPDEPYKSGSIISKLTAIDNDTIEFITTWEPNKYKIEFVKKEDYSGDMDVLDITYDNQNDYFPPNKFSKKGYIFQGWSTSSLGNKVDYEVGDEIPNLSTTENSTVYIYAVWKPIVYSIAFDGNGSTSGEMNDIIDPILYDEEIQLPDVRYEKFGYDFIGWLSSEGGEIIKQNTVKNLTDKNDHRVTLYAQWKQRKYTIIWEDVADGENRTTEEYSNTIPQYSTTPWKSYTDEMHFIFVDWDRPIELLGNEEDGAIIRYKAIFNSEKHEHTQIDVIDPIGANPGYTRHTCPLEECGHYYNDTITWRVIFLEYDETELSNEILNEFEEIFPPSSYVPIETSMDTAREDYYFNGWTKKPGYGYDDGNYIGNSNSEKWMEGANARSNLVYQATYDYHIKTYPVSWYDGDGKLIYYQANVPYGKVPTQPSIIPTKTSTSTEVFSFEYWKLEGASEDGIIQVQGPQNYYAQFSSGVRTYTVIWKNPGVEEPLYVETGIKFKEKIPKYEGDPAKLVHPNEGDPLYTYEFVGWSTEIIDHIPEDSEQDFPDDEELPLVTGDVIYTAVYKKKYQIYNIRARILYQDDEIWINYEDSYYSDEIYLNAYFYGKPAGYTFLQWDDGNKNVIRKIIVEEDKDYKAEYIPNYYTVKWVGYKNNVLKSEQLPYKTKPDPTEVEQMDELKKPYDDKYHYEFDGWEIMRGSVNEKGEILGDVIYRATYKTKEHQWSETEFNFVIDEGYAEAKRYCTCEDCDEWEEHYDRAVVTLTSRVLKGEEVSCDKDGYLTYFASFKDDWNGLVTKKVVIKQTGHLWSDTQRIGKNYDEKGWHYKVCLRCNQAEASVHNWDEGKVDNSNACIDGGVKKFKCRDKGCDGVYHIGMPPGKHKDFISTPGREPTCEEDGNKPYKQCIVCKLYFPEEADANNTPGKFSNSSFIIKALGHAYNKIVHTIVDENTGEVIDLRADCTNSGVVRQICDHGCGIDRIINVPPRKHNWGEVRVDRESTCTENGVGICQCMNTETDYYKKCEAIKSVKLPLKPHVPYIIDSGIPPTCTEKGESDKIICSVCLNTLQDAYEIPALGHHFISKSLIPEENTLRREVLNVCTRKGCNHRYGLYFSD